MIGRLKGIIETIEDDTALIDVGGVGYVVFCSSRTLGQLAPGEAAILVIETHVREDHIHLYGFLTATEREWFHELSTVQRVGSKAALAILGALSTEQIVQAIAAKDTTAFSRISGIGPKLAERIVTELKDRVHRIPAGNLALPALAPAAGGRGGATAALEDAVSALMHLGYGRSEAHAAAMRAAQASGDAPLPDLIRKSLLELAS